jgi:hypothetical protein
MHSILPLLLLSAVVAPPQFDVQLVDGSKVSGSVAAWTEKQLVVETSAGRRELDVAKVASVAAHAPPAKPAIGPAVWVDLADGSRLVGLEFTMAKGRANIVLATASPGLDIAAADVDAVRIQPESASTAIQWSQLRGKKLPGDLLVTGNQAGIDYHQGGVEDMSGDKIRFTLEGKTLNVKRSKVYGLIFFHSAASPRSEPAYTVVDAFGSRWAAATVKLVGNELEFSAAGGRTIHRDLDQITQIDLSCGKIVYLSDLKPDAEKFAPDPFTLPANALPSRLEFSRVRRDQNLESKPLATHDQQYGKGIAMRSRSELAWTLPGKFTRLQAVAGIDDWFRPLGSVRLQITGDGKPLFDRTINGNDKEAAPISLDMTGIRRLVIIVESEGNLGAGDHLVLGNLRLIK